MLRKVKEKNLQQNEIFLYVVLVVVWCVVLSFYIVEDYF